MSYSHLKPTCTDSEGGKRGSGPPPLRFVRGGVLCWCFMGKIGVHRLFYLSIIIFFWLALLASIINSVNIWKIRKKTSKLKRSPLLPDGYTHNLWLTRSPAFMRVPFPNLFGLKLHDFKPLKPKFSGEDPPDPPTSQFDTTYRLYNT